MAVSLPYLASNKNVPALFERIHTAKIPEKFSQAFLGTTIGLKGSNDRAFIPLLRHMGFIDQSSTPTSAYRRLKGHERSGAIADGIRHAYRPLFDSDNDAHKLPSDRLKGLIAQVAGVDADATSRIAGTFSALCKVADFDQTYSTAEPDKTDGNGTEAADSLSAAERSRPKGLRTDFHYNIQIHLPANGSEDTYLNIFNAIRKTFQ